MGVNLYGYNTQRISGISSGMDTETIVKNLMAGQQAKLDKLFQQKEKAQWKYDAYTSVNSTVSSLRSTYLSVLGEKSLTKSSAYNAYTVAMDANNAVKITGTASANSTNFKILSTAKATAASATNVANTQQTEIKGVAGQFMKATVTGSIVLAEGKTLSRDTSIEDLADEFGLKNGDNLSFSINGETFTFNRSDTLGKVIDDISASEKANVTVEFTSDANTGSVTFTSQTTGPDSKIDMSNITGTAFATDAGFGMTNAQVEKQNTVNGTTLFKGLAGLASDAPEEDTKFSINGETFAILNGETVDDVLAKVNAKAGTTGVTMSYDEKNATFVLRNNSAKGNAAIKVGGSLFGEKSVFGVEEGSHTSSGAIKRSDTLTEAARKLGTELTDDGAGNVKVTINGKDFSFKASATLSDMMYTINQDKDAKVSFTYSEMTDSFQIANTATGSNSSLSFSGLEMFGLKQADVKAGADATIKVESQGITREISQASNTFTLDGLTFEVTGTKDFGTEGLEVRVERDFQPTINAIKSFIEDYNKMVGELTTKYYEKSYGAYSPLTEDQRSALTEKEAEKWDEKAKSGLLRNDTAIGSLLTSLRSSLLAKVGDTGLSASDLGISTVAWSSSNWRTEQGKLTLDEGKLLERLKENPNAVQEVLTKITTNDKGETDTTTKTENGKTTASSGLLTRMSSFLSGFNTAMSTKNIVNTQKSITEYTLKMSDMVSKMAAKEESLWAKYSKMETALSNLQSQSNWLSAQLGLSSQN